jgi:hypothetical protein
MNWTKIFSILLFLSGAVFFSLGIYLYWTTNPISGWASILVMTGLLFLLGAIVFLCIGQQYDTSL